MNDKCCILNFIMQENSNTPPIQAESLENPLAKTQPEDIQKIMTFADQIQNPKWQIRKALYENLTKLFQSGRSLVQISSSLTKPQYFCPWIKTMLNESHPSCFTEALRAIQMFTRKYPLTIGYLGSFLGVLIEKSGSPSISTKIADEIIDNCIISKEKGMFLLSELQKYSMHKNHKVSVFAIQSIGKILFKYLLTDQNVIVGMFSLHKQILQVTANKEIRTFALQNMANILQYIKEPFVELCKHQFKKIRPVVLKELSALLREERPDVQVQEIPVQQKKKPVQSEVVDLSSILPENFSLLRSMENSEKKIKVLAQFEFSLKKLHDSKIMLKEYNDIFSQIEGTLEDMNFLVTSAVLRVLKILLFLCKNMISFGTIKRLTNLISDKYKGSKSKNYNIQIHQKITEIYLNLSVSLEQFIDILAEIIEKSKNLNAKIGILQWFTVEYSGIYKKSINQINPQKLRHINNNIRKRLELMLKLDQFLKIKEDVRAVIHFLENIQATPNEQNVIKSKTEIHFHKKQTSSNQNMNFNRTLLNSKSRQKSSKSPIRKSKLAIKNTDRSPIKTTQSQQTREPITVNIKKKLQTLKLQGSKGIKQTQVTESFTKIQLAISQSKYNFEDMLDVLVNFTDELVCQEVSKNKMTQNLRIRPKVRQLYFDWILQLVITINISVRNLDDLVLKKQLQLLLFKMSPSAQSTERFIDHLKDKCSFDSIIQKCAQLFKEKGCNPMTKQMLSHFLRQQLNSQKGSEHVLRYCYKQFLETDGELALTVKGRLRSTTLNQETSTISAVSQSRGRFATPTKQFSQQKYQQLEESLSRQKQRAISNLSIISETIMMYEEKIIENVAKGAIQFKNYIEQISSRGNKTQHSPSEYRTILKAICIRANLANWKQIRTLLLTFRIKMADHSALLIKIFLATVCLTNIFESTEMQTSRDHFYGQLFKNLDKHKILSLVRECFSSVYKKFKNREETKQFVLNTLPYLIQTCLNFDITLKQCEHLAQILVFCLGDEKLSCISAPYLEKIHKSRSTFTSIQKLFEMKIGRYEQLLKLYQQWIQSTLEASAVEVTDGTIADLTQIHEISYEEDSKMGLDLFLNQQKTPGDRIKDRSPITNNRSNRSERKSPINIKINGQKPKQFLVNVEKELQELQRSLEYSKLSQKPQKTYSQIKQMDVYQVERNKARQLTQNQVPRTTQDCVKQLQQMFLTCDQNPNDLLQNLWETYTSFNNSHLQDQFINDLRSCIINSDFLMCLSEIAYKTTLRLLLRLCSNISPERQEADSSKTVQYILHIILSYKNPNQSLIVCIAILSQETPANLSAQLTFSHKILLRLLTNCIQKLCSLIKPTQMRVFEVLLAVYKYFKSHPPEELVTTLPSVQDYEYLFRVLRTISDQFITANPSRALQFLQFIKRKNVSSIYLNYLQGALK